MLRFWPSNMFSMSGFGPPNPGAAARIHGLWKICMTKNDYIEFLSKNLWIWGSQWEYVIERACT